MIGNRKQPTGLFAARHASSPLLDASDMQSTTVVDIQVWIDSLLTWNPADYGGVTYVRVPVSSIWSPDIVLYN